MMHDAYTALPAPMTLDQAQRAIPGQLALALDAAGYREDAAAWLRGMIHHHGTNGENPA